MRMGSFTSAPRIDNKDTMDDDIIPSFQPSSVEELTQRCMQEVSQAGRPQLIKRNFKTIQPDCNGDAVRVLQWNVLSQALGVFNDNFIKCPDEAFDWPSRRFLMLQEIVQHNPDVICLQEVDHFKYFEAALKSVGYEGTFLPKPDSPCMYLNDNNGPDGCALFYKTDRFEQIAVYSRILEVWQVQSNQVGLCAILYDRHTDQEICVATTHLKAKSGALLATLREQQGRDLLNWLYSLANSRPVILCGDFNAEPTEPVYNTTKHHKLNLKSAYSAAGQEPSYTTWKVREDGEVCHTIDYIFHSPCLVPAKLLDPPTEEALGPERAPSMHYPSDHFSLITDLQCRAR